MNFSHSKLHPSIAIAFTYIFTTHAALVEWDKNIPLQSPTKAILSRQKTIQFLSRIASKYGIQENEKGELFSFSKDFQLFGLVGYLDSGKENPICIPEIRKNIIEFLDIPIFKYKKCKNKSGEEEPYDRLTKWLSVSENRLLIATTSLIERLHLSTTYSQVIIYDPHTGVQLSNKLIDFDSIRESTNPCLSNDGKQFYKITIDFQSNNRSVYRHAHSSVKRMPGILFPLLYQGRTVLYNKKEQQKNLETMTMPQAVALQTIKTIAGQHQLATENEPNKPKELPINQHDNLLKPLTEKQLTIAQNTLGCVILENKKTKMLSTRNLFGTAPLQTKGTRKLKRKLFQ